MSSLIAMVEETKEHRENYKPTASNWQNYQMKLYWEQHHITGGIKVKNINSQGNWYRTASDKFPGGPVRLLMKKTLENNIFPKYHDHCSRTKYFTTSKYYDNNRRK
jgi:hypothetical protein